MQCFKRFIVALCIMVTVLNSFDHNMVRAASDDNIIDTSWNDLYNELFSTIAAPYMMTCQPESALILSDSVTIINTRSLSPNYNGGVVDLPRLSSDYYYELSGNNNYMLGQTVYPTLCWRSNAIDTNVTLSIKSEAEQRTVANFIITIQDKTLYGIDYWYPEEDRVISGTGEVIKAGEFEDCSSDIFSSLINGARYYNTLPQIYTPELHKQGIVMDNYIYCADQDFYGLDTVPYSNIDIMEHMYKFDRKEIGALGATTTFDIKEYVGTLNSTYGLRSGLLFAGSKFKDCIFDNNTGTCTTKVTSDDEDLYYFIALSSGCYFGCVGTKSVNSDELTSISSSAPSMSWEYGKYYNLESGRKSEAGYTTDIPNSYCGYGPVSFDGFWKLATSDAYRVTYRSGKYSFSHYNKDTRRQLNVFTDALFYSGCVAHLGTATLVNRQSQLTITYYYTLPDDVPGTWHILSTEQYDAEDVTVDDLLTLPEIDDYKASAWNTDTTLSKAFLLDSIPKDADTQINLYAGYTYVGGSYTVTFINNATGSKEVQEYKANEQPTLPNNPTEMYEGHRFKYWAIVSSEDATVGVSYNPDTFNPEANENYIFKTMWDIAGIITKVLTTKTNYYIGQSIDRSLLQVWVQDSNDSNDTRQLNDTEYTIDDDIIKQRGTNRFTITYTRTGATAICEVNGLEVLPTSITATYKGGDTILNTELTPSMFNVYLMSNDGSSNEVTEFTIYPTVITNVGANVITINYTDYTARVTINGIKDSSAAEQLVSITAAYTGKQPYVGDTISASDILCTAFYADNSSKTVANTAFKFNPSKFNVAGEQSVIVTYGGLSAVMTINVLPVQTSSSGNNNQNTGNNNQNSGNTNNQNTGNNNNQNTGQQTSNNQQHNNSQQTNNPTASGNNTSPSGNNNNYYNNNTSTGNGNTGIVSSSNGNGNTSIGSSTASVTSSTSSDNGKGTSPGYLHAANILTNTMGLANATNVSVVDIREIISGTDDNSDVYITLTNGANGNDITSDILSEMKERSLTLHLDMVSRSNSRSVANWMIVGSQLDDTSRYIDPNITFEVTDKETDRLVYFATSNSSYPTGVSLDVTPELNCYGSGELVRLYTCDIIKNNAKLVQTITWQDTYNGFSIDVYKQENYCLSNSASVYPNGASLNDINGLPSAIATNPDDADDFDWGDNNNDSATEDPFDAGSSIPNSKIDVGKLLPLLVIGVILAAVITLVIVIILIIRSRGRKSGDSTNTDSFV